MERENYYSRRGLHTRQEGHTLAVTLHLLEQRIVGGAEGGNPRPLDDQRTQRMQRAQDHLITYDFGNYRAKL